MNKKQLKMNIVNIGFNAVNGYSLVQLNNILRHNIIQISIRRRLFCIFDREYKYTVLYSYKNYDCKNEQLVFSSYPFAQIYWTPYQIVTITKRYKSIKDINDLLKLYNDIKTDDLE